MISHPHPSPPPGTSGHPAGPAPDGSVVITIPAPVVSAFVAAAVLYVLYLVLTSERVGVRVPWRRLGWCLVFGAVAGAGSVGWVWKTEPAKLAADARGAGLSLHAEVAITAGGIALGTGLLAFCLVAFGVRVRAKRRASRSGVVVAAPDAARPPFPSFQPGASPYRPGAPPSPFRPPGGPL